MLRITIRGRRREMGLGSAQNVSLGEARQLANDARKLALGGTDPIKDREMRRREAERADNTLQKMAKEAFEARRAELKGGGIAGRWFSPLELHVLPKLGKVPVEELDQRDIRDALAPIWHDKAATARKAVDRLGIVLKYSAALGLDVDLQATDKAKALLGKSRHVSKNIPALPWKDVPAFYASLSEPSITHLALKLLILTGLRSRPVRFCRTDEIKGDVWIVPADLMKGRIGATSNFRVPLSQEAQRVLEMAKPFERGGYLFPSARKGVISDAAMARLMERRGMAERPHGFRSSLRTWLAEATKAPHEVAEIMLAHSSGTSVERAYRRTDFLEQRRELLERWASHVVSYKGRK